MRDITDLKLAEEATEKARMIADQANRAKSDFLANMSHEVRTPVNAIMGIAHLALHDNPDLRQREYLLKIQTGAKHLLGIMNDILDFSKVEAGKLQFERIDFPLSEVVDSVRDTVGQKAQEKNLRLVFDLAAEVPAFVNGDPLRLSQVLINLVNNAVKFTETGEVRVRVTHLSQEENSVFLRFSVSDSGIGMTATQIENLFQAFYQADTSFTRQYGGTGLGLAISRQLVELMGGAMSVESQLGEGSTFAFTIRLGHAHQAAPIAAHKSPAASTATRILIVDDSEITRDQFAALLRKEGQEVHSVESGEEALNLLLAGIQRGQPFDLVITDWRLPGINGVETCRRIRSRSELQPSPGLVMISAFDRQDLVPAGKLAAFDEFLRKPIDERALLRTVQSLLDGRTTAAEKIVEPVQEDRDLLAGRKVLLVEDNELNRFVAKGLLTALGVSISIVVDGQAGVDAIMNNKFDVVLMDVQMPVMDGLTATRTIRADGRFADLPIVAMTAHAMTGDYERSLAAGMNDHITKPIKPDVLKKTLLRWMPARPILVHREAPESAVVVAEDLPAFNTVVAMAQSNRSPLLLRKLLLGFAQQYASAGADLDDLMLDEKWQEAKGIIHSLKSMAALLETPPLAASSSDGRDCPRTWTARRSYPSCRGAGCHLATGRRC